ncbi:transposase [Salmonella enterica subsp. diarizonae]|nr:transposase [Salmonella enterica subsp. diarizonae]
MYTPRPAKLLFTVDDGWNRFLSSNGDSVSPWSRLCVERMLACGTTAMGVRRYCCSSPECSHSRFFCQSCKSKACSSCGFKATEQWVSQQSNILPDCDWQHITFTMPHLLWPFFNNNWPLLNALFRAATRAMLRWARKQGVEVGIFCALHTYGRQLNQHPHIHLSVTRGGLDIRHDVWRELFFKKRAVEEIWRGAVIRLLRHSYELINPGRLPGLGHIRDKKQWRRYLKRPPVSAAKLRHYSGGAVVHHYYDHRTQQYRQQTLSQEEMIGRYISHIPAKHFKMVRYYGFLSSRKRGTLLPKVYKALQMEARKKPEQPGFAALMKGFLRTDPYKCILCGNRLHFSSAQAGRHATELVAERLHEIDRKRWLLAQAAG